LKGNEGPEKSNARVSGRRTSPVVSTQTNVRQKVTKKKKKKKKKKGRRRKGRN